MMFLLQCMFCIASVLVDAFMDDGAIPIAKGFGEDPDVLCDVTMFQVSYMHWFHGPSMSGCSELASHRCRDSDRLNYRRACRKANQLINLPRSDHYRQRIDDALSDARQCSKLLHAKDTDKTRTDDENRNLFCTFGHYFVNKIVKLRDSVSDILCLIVICIC